MIVARHIGDSTTGNHWHAFAFYPGEREKSAAFYTVEPAPEAVDRTITVQVNPVFRATYCTDATRMTVRVVEDG